MLGKHSTWKEGWGKKIQSRNPASTTTKQTQKTKTTKQKPPSQTTFYGFRTELNKKKKKRKKTYIRHLKVKPENTF